MAYRSDQETSCPFARIAAETHCSYSEVLAYADALAAYWGGHAPSAGIFLGDGPLPEFVKRAIGAALVREHERRLSVQAEIAAEERAERFS